MDNMARDNTAPRRRKITTEEMNNMTVGQKIKHAPAFVKNQIVSLKPPGEIPMNPWTCLRMLNRRQWAFFFIGFFGWTWVITPPQPPNYPQVLLLTA